MAFALLRISAFSNPPQPYLRENGGISSWMLCVEEKLTPQFYLLPNQIGTLPHLTVEVTLAGV